MRKPTIWMIAFSSLLSVAVASAQDPASVVERVRRDTQGAVANDKPRQAQPYTKTSVAAREPAAKSLRALASADFSAQDGSFTIKLPSDWSLPVGQIEQFIATSPRGEIVAFARHDVVFDQETVNQAGGLLGSTGVSVPGVLLGPLGQPTSPPLEPVEVILSIPVENSPLYRSKIPHP